MEKGGDMEDNLKMIFWNNVKFLWKWSGEKWKQSGIAKKD